MYSEMHYGEVVELVSLERLSSLCVCVSVV